MIIHRVNIPIQRKTEFTIRHITDVHQDSDGFHKVLWRKFMDKQRKDKDSYWICTGDLIDADRPSTRDRKRITFSDRPEAFRHEDKKDKLWLDNYVIPQYKSMADNCLGILDGDHFIIFSNGMTSGQYIAQKAGLPYLGERMAYVLINFFRPESRDAIRYTILARHGKGFSNTAGGDMGALERQSMGFDADLYLGGHTHKSNVHHEQKIGPDLMGKGLKQRVLWYVRGGSFLWGYPPGKTTYVEHNEYSPLSTGWAEIKLTLNRPHSSNRALCISDSCAGLVVG